MTKKTNSNDVGMAAVVGAGIVAAGAAAAAGYYFYWSDDAKEHRKEASRWVGILEKEAMKKVSQLKRVSKSGVTRIIDEIAKTESERKPAETQEIIEAAKVLKRDWDDFEKALRTTLKKGSVSKRKSK